MRYAAEYFALAREREQIRIRRAAGVPPPWTRDPIFAAWKFCNVRREDDKTTAWFREQVRLKLDGLPVVEATVIFRWFNRIETGERILDLLLHGWDSAEALHRLQTQDRVFTGAYKISHHSHGKLFTGAYIVKSPDGKSKLRGILDCIDEARRRLPVLMPQWGATLQGAWADLRTCPFLGPFMAYEVVSDLRWTPVLRSATDIDTWCNIGPGAARGLGYVAAGDPQRFNPGSSSGQEAMLAIAHELLAMSREEACWPQAWPMWEMREAEHWACEYWKYVRCRDYGQPPRQKFTAGLFR